MESSQTLEHGHAIDTHLLLEIPSVSVLIYIIYTYLLLDLCPRLCFLLNVVELFCVSVKYPTHVLGE